MIYLLPLAMAGALIGTAFWVEKYSKQKQAEVWTAAADQVGFQFTPSTEHGSFGRLFGSIGEMQVSVSIYARGDKDAKTNFTRYRVQFPRAFEGSFSMRRQGLLSFMDRLFGQKDDRLGDQDFDSSVMLTAPDPEAVERYLTPARRSAVLQLMDDFHVVQINPARFTVERRGVEKDHARLVATIENLAEVALVLGAPSDTTLAVDQRDRSDLADDMPVFDPESGEWKTGASRPDNPVDDD